MLNIFNLKTLQTTHCILHSAKWALLTALPYSCFSVATIQWFVFHTKLLRGLLPQGIGGGTAEGHILRGHILRGHILTGHMLTGHILRRFNQG